MPLFGAEEAAKPQTVIDSDTLSMQAGDDVNTFLFKGSVHAEGRSMLLICDELKIIARRKAGSDSTVGQMGSVDLVEATGNVRIEQAGRVATAGKAEVKPVDGLVILSDNPRIVDSKATVVGWKIVYNSKDKTVQVLPDPNPSPASGESAGRSRVILSEDAIPKIDYNTVLGNEEEKTAETEAPSEEATPESSEPAQPEVK